jgi:hypothetical protein
MYVVDVAVKKRKNHKIQISEFANSMRYNEQNRENLIGNTADCQN